MSCYGRMLFGLCVPWPPAWVLWGLIAADLVLTYLGSRHGHLLPLGIVLSAYLAIAGMFSIGLLVAVLGIVQILLLLRHLRQHRSTRT
jgi:uncharacterized membrane protein